MQKGEWDNVSERYYEEVLSPIKNSWKNPLFDDIERIKDKSKRVIDLGCGIGEIEDFLSKKFKNVVGIDFSEKMIETAKERNKGLGNVKFLLKDMSDLKDFYGEFDVAIAINSIIDSDIKRIDKIFGEIYNIIKENGTFIAIFPSMEVFAYQSLIMADEEINKDRSQEQVRKKIRELIMEKEHDFLLGLTDFEGKQKHYYRFEVLWRLKKTGFKNIRIKKVFYPWKEFRDAGQGYFPDEDPPWDWYVICGK